MHYQSIIHTPIGKIGLVISKTGLSALHFLSKKTAVISPNDKFTQQIVADIESYFESAPHVFSSPLDIQVTPFQQKVLTQLTKIPCGQVLTYAEVAEKIKTGARAVGNACRNNPVPVLIPCHRVIATGGGLGGYSGARSGEWLAIKRWLLTHEGYGGE